MVTNTKATKGHGPLLYRLYFRLMDIAFAMNVLALSFGVVGAAIGLEAPDLHPLVYYGIPILYWPINYIIAPLLIVNSSMRDEYADILWKRTIAQVMVIAAVLPPIVWALIWFVSIFIIQGDLANWKGYRPDWLLDPLMEESYRLLTIMFVWQGFVLGFVFLFQWNRWRDSRGGD